MSFLEKLWKSRNIMLEVLRDRNYKIDDVDFMEYEDFITWAEDMDEIAVRKNMTLTYEKSDKIGHDKIIVLWPFEKKLGTNIRDISLELENLNIKRAIIIVNDSVTNWGKGFIRRLRVDKIYIDIYTLDEAQFNIMKHKLVPEHVICSTVEKKKILASYGVKQDEIPQIKLTDPVIRHLGANRGQLIKITRKSETQPGWPCITYRTVS